MQLYNYRQLNVKNSRNHKIMINLMQKLNVVVKLSLIRCKKFMQL